MSSVRPMLVVHQFLLTNVMKTLLHVSKTVEVRARVEVARVTKTAARKPQYLEAL